MSGILGALSRTTPLIGRFRPAGEQTVLDLHHAGGIPAVLRWLAPLLHHNLPTITSESISERANAAPEPASRVLRSLDDPLFPEGGLAVLVGNPAPNLKPNLQRAPRFLAARGEAGNQWVPRLVPQSRKRRRRQGDALVN